MWSVILAVLIGLFTSEAIAQEKQEKKPNGKPGVVMAEGASITATVEAQRCGRNFVNRFAVSERGQEAEPVREAFLHFGLQ